MPDEPTMDGIGKVQFGILAACSGDHFLSAVADRFGLWDTHGQPNVAWGNYARFLD